MNDKFKMLIDLNITDDNIVMIEEIVQLLLENNAISLTEYSNVLTSAMCFRTLTQEQMSFRIML